MQNAAPLCHEGVEHLRGHGVYLWEGSICARVCGCVSVCVCQGRQQVSFFWRSVHWTLPLGMRAQANGASRYAVN